MERLSPSQITVVVQGPVFGCSGDPAAGRVTQQGLLSVRRHLPGAEIILSTWEGADTTELDFDRLLLQADPGPALFLEVKDKAPRVTNVNRMIVSTLAGLKAASRPYVLKARTDLKVRSAGFLDYFGRFAARASTPRIFVERVLAHEQFTRFPDRCGRLHYLFHPGDCFQFGRRDDLLTLWDQPLLLEADAPTEFTNEQYVWVRCLQKSIDVPFTEWSQSSLWLMELAERALANNFVVLSRRQFGIDAGKLPFDLLNWTRTYTHAEWRRLYGLCGGDPASASFDPVTILKTLSHLLYAWPRAFEPMRRMIDKISHALRRR